MISTKAIETFCFEYLANGDATAAYVAAGFGEDATKASRQQSASRMLKDKRVVARLAEMRAAVAGAGNVSLQSHLADLLWLREQAAASGKYAAAVQAEISRGRAVGLYIDRVAMSAEVTVEEKKADLTKLSADELRNLYSTLMKAGVETQTLQ